MPHDPLQGVDIHSRSQAPEGEGATKGVGVAMLYASALIQSPQHQPQPGIRQPCASR